jgi:hypothetical protein
VRGPGFFIQTETEKKNTQSTKKELEKESRKYLGKNLLDGEFTILSTFEG